MKMEGGCNGKDRSLHPSPNNDALGTFKKASTSSILNNLAGSRSFNIFLKVEGVGDIYILYSLSNLTTLY
jgi:hypothetical protein